jgi:hypothetical protein
MMLPMVSYPQTQFNFFPPSEEARLAGSTRSGSMKKSEQAEPSPSFVHLDLT